MKSVRIRSYSGLYFLHSDSMQRDTKYLSMFSPNEANNSEYGHFLRIENWHSLSHEQYFSTQCFLDICPWVFNITTIFIIVIIIIVMKVCNYH